MRRLGGDTLVRIIRSSAARFESEAEQPCYEAVASEALSAGEDAHVALAVLLTNDLQKGLWSGDTTEFAEAASDQVRRASSRLRSALLRGLDTLEDYSHRTEPEARFLPEESRLTRPKEMILPQLCQIARGMDQATRSSVAAADFGYRAEEHLRALNDVLSTENCRFPEGETWVPSEVVELVTHVRETDGFIPCTALLLVNAILTNDHMGWFDCRWENLGKEYNVLPGSVRAPILAGIRYLYEADIEFMFYSQSTVWHPVDAPERMIQQVDLPGDTEASQTS